jgi:hypothetical protein
MLGLVCEINDLRLVPLVLSYVTSDLGIGELNDMGRPGSGLSEVKLLIAPPTGFSPLLTAQTSDVLHSRNTLRAGEK